MWFQLNKIRRSAKDEIRAEVYVPETSVWFDGHFPGEPVLPGVAQVAMVYDVLKTVSDSELNILSVNRIRFRRIIRPGDELKIIASPMEKDPGMNAFRILIGDDLACSGIMRVKKVLSRNAVKE